MRELWNPKLLRALNNYVQEHQQNSNNILNIVEIYSLQRNLIMIIVGKFFEIYSKNKDLYWITNMIGLRKEQNKLYYNNKQSNNDNSEYIIIFFIIICN